MNNNINFRSFKEGDYETCCNWWRWWWKGEDPIEEELLPGKDYCFLVEKNNIPIAAGFLYVDKSSPVGYFTYVVSNPEYKEKDRRDIIEYLIHSVEKESKSQGIKYLFTVCGNVHMENMHKKLGWIIDKTAPAWESFKYL